MTSKPSGAAVSRVYTPAYRNELARTEVARGVIDQATADKIMGMNHKDGIKELKNLSDSVASGKREPANPENYGAIMHYQQAYANTNGQSREAHDVALENLRNIESILTSNVTSNNTPGDGPLKSSAIGWEKVDSVTRPSTEK